MTTKNYIAFRTTASGRIGAIHISCEGIRGWHSHKSFSSIDEAISGTYMPPGWQLERRLMSRAEADELVADLPKPARGVIEFGDQDGIKVRWTDESGLSVVFTLGSRDSFEERMEAAWIEFRRHRDSGKLHVQATPSHWLLPHFPARDSIDVSSLALSDGRKTLSVPRQTHVIDQPAQIVAGSGADRKIVHPAGYHTEPEPTVCGTYWADCCLKIGPGHWHAEAVYDACILAVRSMNAVSGFVADVCDSAFQRNT